MLEHPLFAVAVGILLGFLTGLGVGGGSLLILYLTAVMHMEPGSARILNLLFFLPTALIASFFRYRQGQLPLKGLLPAVLAGCAAAAGFSFLSRALNPQVLKKLFGVLLLLTGLRELLYRPRKAR